MGELWQRCRAHAVRRARVIPQLEGSRFPRRLPALVAAGLVLVAMLIPAEGGSPRAGQGADVHIEAALYPADSDRFGVGVNPAYGQVTDFDVGRLKAGWYVDWRTQLSPPYPAGLDYAHIVRVSGDAFRPGEDVLAEIVAANRGATWIIGNEPDCIWQDDSTPDQYARVYGKVHSFLKARDPQSQVTIGGIVQVTPLRLQWLEAVLAAYRRIYGTPLPVDLWNIHAFILREERGSWGAEIPPGISASRGMLWEIEDHDRQDLFAQQIVRFRQWMRDHGQRDKELVVSEYGILLPDSYGFDEPRVSAFMRYTFDYFQTAADPELGCPGDGNRLVQRWAWYSLNDRRFEGHTSHSHLFDPTTAEVTPLGLEYGRYVSPLYAPYVDLHPVAIDASPAAPLCPGGRPVTVTITAVVRNAGNTDASDISVRLWTGDPSTELGDEHAIAVLPARSRASVSAEWQNVPCGVSTVGVTVDGEDNIAEADEGNNQHSRALLAGRYATYLPLATEGR